MFKLGYLSWFDLKQITQQFPNGQKQARRKGGGGLDHHHLLHHHHIHLTHHRVHHHPIILITTFRNIRSSQTKAEIKELWWFLFATLEKVAAYLSILLSLSSPARQILNTDQNKKFFWNLGLLTCKFERQRNIRVSHWSSSFEQLSQLGGRDSSHRVGDAQIRRSPLSLAVLTLQ